MLFAIIQASECVALGLHTIAKAYHGCQNPLQRFMREVGLYYTCEKTIYKVQHAS